MVQINKANIFGSLSLEKLVNFENEFNIDLPTDYKNFLLKHNYGEPYPRFFWIQPGSDGSEVFHFWGIHNGPSHLSIDTYLRRERYYPKSMLPVGDDGVGNYICIGISNTNFGEVYFLDHEDHSFDDPDSLVAFKKLANSFTEFLSILTEPPE